MNKMSCGCDSSLDESEKVYARKARTGDHAYCPAHGDVILEGPALYRAAALIDADNLDWYDFCANNGMIPGNVSHMPRVRAAFAQWLEDTGYVEET